MICILIFGGPVESGFSVSSLQIHSLSKPNSRSHLSSWTKSPLKRLFDFACVLCALPLAVPVLLATAVAVRITSRGPALFRQKRVGRHHRPFTIYKFRTMPVPHDRGARPALTTTANQTFTPIGPFLRRWKLDELPQILNVLTGDMSLVGPRPKMPQLHAGHLACRPGITGRATVVFAREEAALAAIPAAHIDHYYRNVVAPLKQQLDDDYMADATLASDLDLILRSIVRRFDDSEIRALLPPLATAETHQSTTH
jgi:lipopolysaccharide/colanic/teichoic acid biosynthesis glycosyltransferase